jgi:uncharacterized protein
MTATRRLAAIPAADAMLTTAPKPNLFAKADLPQVKAFGSTSRWTPQRDGRLLALRFSSRCGRTMKRIKTLFASGVLALALFGVARAGPFEDAQAADQKVDYATEMRILRPLAEQGNALAELGLGVMYANGQGVPQDNAQAVVWCLKAADQGNDRAQFGLGLMYADGHGAPHDYVRAHMWFAIAAAAADASDVSVRDALKWRDLVATRMTPGQIAEARRLAGEWKPTK